MSDENDEIPGILALQIQSGPREHTKFGKIRTGKAFADELTDLAQKMFIDKKEVPMTVFLLSKDKMHFFVQRLGNDVEKEIFSKLVDMLVERLDAFAVGMISECWFVHVEDHVEGLAPSENPRHREALTIVASWKGKQYSRFVEIHRHDGGIQMVLNDKMSDEMKLEGRLVPRTPGPKAKKESPDARNGR